jgi:hypothetical protein|tara:strand:- start:102 stop:512 length:411 start_codon:yes stop_codon:yes gene_type:complete
MENTFEVPTETKKTNFVFNQDGSIRLAAENLAGITIEETDTVVESDIQIEYDKTYKLVNGEIIAEDYEMPLELITAARWDEVRKTRNKLLEETDWIVTVSNENGTSVPDNWKEYRQALRDITTQADPNNVTWPTKP